MNYAAAYRIAVPGLTQDLLANVEAPDQVRGATRARDSA